MMETVKEPSSCPAVPAALTNEGTYLTCEVCGKEGLESNTQLFKHLEREHGYEGAYTKPLKVVLLVGWAASLEEDNEQWIPDHYDVTNTMSTNPTSEFVENALFRAIHKLENDYYVPQKAPSNAPAFTVKSAVEADAKSNYSIIEDTFERPKGFSRCTGVDQRSSMLLSAESSLSGGCDTFCMPLKRWRGPGGEQGWIDLVNGFLPPSVRVLHKYLLESNMNFHAEMHCSHRLYECMLPLRMIMKEENDDTPYPQLPEQTHEGASEAMKQYRAMSAAGKEAKGSKSLPPDEHLPTDPKQKERYLEFFAHLKAVMKIVAGKRSFHNFVTAGACPEDSVVCRKLDRLYHRNTVNIDGEDWIVFGASSDALLRGQMRKLVGLILGVMRGWLPLSYMYAALSTDMDSEQETEPNKCHRSKGTTIADVPAVPGFLTYVSECKFAFWEAKYYIRLDPRRVAGEGIRDSSVLRAWTRELQHHIATKLATKSCCNFLAPETTTNSWLSKFKASCLDVYSKYARIQDMQARSVEELDNLYTQKFQQPCTRHAVVTQYDAKKAHAAAAVASKDGTAGVTTLLQKRGPVKKFNKKDAKHLKKETKRTKEVKLFATALAAKEEEEKVAVAAAAAAEMVTNRGMKEINDVLDDDSGAMDMSTTEEIPFSAVPSSSSSSSTSSSSLPGKSDTTLSNDDGVSTYTTTPAAVVVVPKPTCFRFVDGNLNTAPTDVTHLYSEVLQLLQQADQSGRWPSTSTGRSTVINKNTMAEFGGTGGSFSIGALPAHFVQPKMNDVFPELVRACFALERALCPHRTPSSTIAVNRHTQFLPHRDTGAGHGQSKSLIVGLGDYVGGELVVENVAKDIRYNPVEFDGWMERHWTLPFAGERFSLVWFTPLGLGPNDTDLANDL